MMPPPFVSNNYRWKESTTSNVVTIDVGGQLFQTTKSTLTQAGSQSLFFKLATSHIDTIPFIDRDPELFSILLSLLRTGNLPSKAKAFDTQDLVFESQFYGIEQLLINSKSNPSGGFEAFNLEKSMVLPLSGRDSPASLSTTPQHGSVHVAHASKLTSFDWSLHRKSTILTQFTAIDSLLALSPNIVTAGATDFPGLQIIDVDKGCVRETLNWENITRSDSTVQAIGSSNQYLFTSFESSRRNSNCIMVYDLRNNFKPVIDIGHYEIFGADLDSGIPATKLRWISSLNLLMASGSHSGPAGVSGNIRFWDLRSGIAVCEMKEKLDCFSDITVSDSLSAVFKVGVLSGELFYTDLRKIGGGENMWVCLGDTRKVITSSSSSSSGGRKEGVGCKIESHGNQVFCSKGGNLELWSQVLAGFSNGRDGLEDDDRVVFRKNSMGRANDSCSNRITHLSFGGNKMFVTRKDQQFVEVWHNSVM